jgi:hypothetical protein
MLGTSNVSLQDYTAAVKANAADDPILAGSLMAAYDFVNGVLTGAIQAV